MLTKTAIKKTARKNCKGTTCSTARQSIPMRSTTQKAKTIIRDEIKSYYNPANYGVKTSLDAIKKDAEAGSAGRNSKNSDWAKGARLVDGGCLAVSPNNQKRMLKKIYGDKVEEWSGDKTHNTYKNLIGREYAAMLSEREKAKLKKAQEKATKKEKAQAAKTAKKSKGAKK